MNIFRVNKCSFKNPSAAFENCVVVVKGLVVVAIQVRYPTIFLFCR